MAKTHQFIGRDLPDTFLQRHLATGTVLTMLLAVVAGALLAVAIGIVLSHVVIGVLTSVTGS